MSEAFDVEEYVLRLEAQILQLEKQLLEWRTRAEAAEEALQQMREERS